MDDVRIELAKIATRQETIVEKLTKQSEILKEQASTLSRQHLSLEMHIKRTEINEDAIQHVRIQTAALLEVADAIKQRIEPLEIESTKRVAVREFGLACLKWGTGIASVGAAIYGLLEFLSK
jgi:hypothetical protein